MTDTGTEEIRVMVVDDHPLMRVGIAAIINSQPNMCVVGHAGTVSEAVRLARDLRPDLTLMDLRLPDGNGVGAIRAIRQNDPAARIIVVTTYEGDEDIHQALAAGASGYLIKGMSHDILIQAVRRVHAGGRFLPSTVKQVMLSRTPSSLLSQRELQVLELMFAGFANREIANRLEIKEATVKTHVSVILNRLGVEDRTQAVVEALKRGLVHL